MFVSLFVLMFKISLGCHSGIVALRAESGIEYEVFTYYTYTIVNLTVPLPLGKKSYDQPR